MYPLGTLMAMKDAGVRIRVQRDLRERFLEVCRGQDKPAAQVLREFMRAYVAKHGTEEVTSDQPQDDLPEVRPVRLGRNRNI